MKNLNVGGKNLRFRGLVGTGGIGTGVFLALMGNHTLGREESRACRVLDHRDYCKLHIISHYVQSLMGPSFRTALVGCVGEDDAGKRLLDEIRAAGMESCFIKTEKGAPTLFSYCFLYPDGSGGNITIADSASFHVDPAQIDETEEEMRKLGKYGIALAVPEVPMKARARLLELATQYGLFRVASFTSGEMEEAAGSGMLKNINLLALNADEAASAAGIRIDGNKDAAAIAPEAIRVLAAANPGLMLSVTAGTLGSWSWDGEKLNHVAVFPVEVASSAGAGDAHIAGVIAGLAAGLELAEAQELGGLQAALSVTSPHTIHKGIDRSALRRLAGDRVAPRVMRLLTS